MVLVSVPLLLVGGTALWYVLLARSAERAGLGDDVAQIPADEGAP